MTSLFASPWLKNTLLWVCLVAPWLNPFTSPPSTAVLPLLLSWMLAACALWLLADVNTLPQPTQQGAHPHPWTRWGWISLGVALAISLFTRPPLVDVGATMGLLGALMCFAVTVAVGRRVAAQPQQGMSVVMIAWLAAATLSSVLGVLQYLDLASALSPWVNQPFYKGDAFANLRQRNQFASLTSVGLVVLLAWAYRIDAARLTSLATSGRRWHWLLAFVALQLLAAGVASSVSRTGGLQWLLITALALLWAWRLRAQPSQVPGLWWWLVISVPLSLLLWSVVLPAVAQLVTGQQGASLVLRLHGQAQEYAMCGRRQVLWANVWQLIALKPWLGWGWGETDLAHFLTPYVGPRFCDILDNAHNLPLHVALEFGLPLAVLMCVLCVAWVWVRQPWRERDPSRAMAWGVLVVLGVHSFLEYPLWYGPFQMAVGLSVGLLWHRLAQNDPPHVPSAPSAPAQTTFGSAWRVGLAPWLASLFFLACLYAAWDFHRVSQIYKPVASRDPAYSANPLAHAKQSWLFRNQAEFAELTLLKIEPSNAQAVYDLAHRVVHYSPEARAVQPLIDSARLLGHDDEANHWAARLDIHQRDMQR